MRAQHLLSDCLLDGTQTLDALGRDTDGVIDVALSDVTEMVEVRAGSAPVRARAASSAFRCGSLRPSPRRSCPTC